MSMTDAQLNKIKMALRVTTTAYDDEISDLADAALLDLGIAGADGDDVTLTNALAMRAVITYVRMHFGSPDDYDRLKESYDEQKAQMSMATNYTVWNREEAA